MFFPLGSPAILTSRTSSTQENSDDEEDEDYLDDEYENDQIEEAKEAREFYNTNSNHDDNSHPPSIPNGLSKESAISKSTPILLVCCNRERLIVAVLTWKTLYLYSANPQTLLVAYTRSKKSLSEKGHNERLLWKPDSSAIAITTSSDHLLFYKVDLSDSAHQQSSSYELRDSSKPAYKRNSLELIVQQRLPKVRVSPAANVKLASKASSFVTLKEELIVGLTNGWLHRLLWNGHVMEDFSTPADKIPFYYELESKPEYLSLAANTAGRGASIPHFVDLVYSPLIGGFGFVLSNGRAGLLIAQSPRYHPSELRAIWAPSLSDAVCCAANHKYRLLAFGCRSSSICAYFIDETSGALIQSYRVQLSTSDNPAVCGLLGRVRHLEWSPYGTTLVVTWSNRGVAGFSVFGSQLWFDDSHCTPSFDWGPEGHQLWLAGGPGAVRVWQCVRPPSVNNCAMGHNKRLTLVGATIPYHILLVSKR